jgi:ferredoxin
MASSMALRSGSACSTSRPVAAVRASRRTAVAVRAAEIGGTACRDKVGQRKEFKSQGKTYKLTFLASGEARTIDCPDDMYILDAADKNGIDLPATCRGGICGACVTKVVKGLGDVQNLMALVQ